MNKIKISVIIPIYNSTRFLNDNIRSICDQTLSEIEILFVDDCSTDNSVEIISKYKKNDNRIKILKNSNHEGAAIARNYGLKFANGEYIIFLDSDDLFDAKLLENLYNLAKEKNCDIVFTKYSIIDENGIFIDRNQGVSDNVKEDINYADLSEYYNLFTITTPAPWNKLYKKSFLIEKNILFQNLATCNDLFFFKYSFVEARSIYFKNKELIKYRQYCGDNISSKRHKYCSCCIDANRLVFKKLKNSNKNVSIINFFYFSSISNFIYEYKKIISKIEKIVFLKNIYYFLPKKYFFYMCFKIKCSEKLFKIIEKTLFHLFW